MILSGSFQKAGISRSGNLQTFRPGLLKILKGTDAPVIPMYVDGIWGSIFSYEGGRSFGKFRNGGDILYPSTTDLPYIIRKIFIRFVRRVQSLGAKAVENRMQRHASLQRQVISIV